MREARKRLMVTSGVLMSAIFATTTSGALAGWTGQVPDGPSSSKKPAPLWIRYLQAGEQAQKKGKSDIAKRYLLGSLAELERTASAGHGAMFQAGMLEQDLVQMYPSDWTKAKGDQPDKLKLREEQVSVLARINKFNHDHHVSKLFTEQYQRQYEAASQALEKEKAGAPVGEGEPITPMPRVH